MVINFVVSDVWFDCGYYVGEICVQLGQVFFEVGVVIESDEYIGKVDVGCMDCNFDLFWFWWNVVKCGQFYCLYIVGGMDLQVYVVLLMICDDGVLFLRM